jgi:hypothetical protein
MYNCFLGVLVNRTHGSCGGAHGQAYSRLLKWKQLYMKTASSMLLFHDEIFTNSVIVGKSIMLHIENVIFRHSLLM